MNEKEKLDKLEKKDKLMKSTAKFWGIILIILVAIAVIWFIVSNL